MAFSASGQHHATADAEIFSVLPDGSDQRQLTDNAAPDLQPSWSADGAMIAFARDLGHTTDVFTMNGDGSEQRQLTAGAPLEFQPALAPDGASIAFVKRTRSAKRAAIVETSTEGTGTAAVISLKEAKDVAYSPSGRRIAFVGDPAHRRRGVWPVRRDGSHLRRIAVGPKPDRRCGWGCEFYELDFSPDGRSVIYNRGFFHGPEIYRAPADGSSPPERIAYGHELAFAPAGDRIGISDYDYLDACADIRVFLVGSLVIEDTLTDNCADHDDLGTAGSLSWQPLP